MSKEVEIFITLELNKGWWITAFIDGECEGTINRVPYVDLKEAHDGADRAASNYRLMGYDPSITTRREPMPLR